MKTELLEISDKIRNTGYLTMSDKKEIADALDKLAGGRPDEKAKTPKAEVEIELDEVEEASESDGLDFARELVRGYAGEVSRKSIQTTMLRVKQEHNDPKTRKKLKVQLKNQYNDLTRLLDTL